MNYYKVLYILQYICEILAYWLQHAFKDLKPKAMSSFGREFIFNINGKKVVLILIKIK